MAQLICAKNATDSSICRACFSGLNSIVFKKGVAHWQLCGLVAFLLIVTPGCTTPGVGPDDMTAEAHRVTAEVNQEQAAEHRARYDPNAIVTPAPRYIPYSGYYGNGYGYGTGYGYGYGYGSGYGSGSGYGYGYNDFYWDVQSYNPTQRHLNASTRLERHADDHLAAAESLESFEEAECKAFPPQTRGACPLLGQVEVAQDVFGGVRLRFIEGVDVNAAIAHMRCHFAFARTRGRIGMESCPLYIIGVAATRLASSDTVDLSVGNDEDLEELRRRIREHLVVDSPE